MAKQHFFGGVDLLQEFPEQQSYFDQTYGQDFEQSRIHQNQPLQPYKPKNLGIELFHTLQTEYRNRRKVNTFSADALYELWKVVNRSNLGKPKPKRPAKEPDSELLKKQQQHKDNMYFYSQADGRDVLYTLRQYAREEEQDANISKFMDERQSMIKQQEEEEAKKKNRRLSRQVQERLYPAKSQSYVDPKQQEKKERNEFVEAVMKDYRRRNADSSNYRYPDLLKQHWTTMADKPQGQAEAFDEYFQESMETICEHFYKMKGFYSDKVDKIVKVWRQIVDKQEIIKFESEENLRQLLSGYLADKKQNENIQTGLKKLDMEKKAKEPKKLPPHVKNVKVHTYEELAAPKDRLKVGKTLLELRKMYPNDRILRQMLLQEFRDTKVAKHPLEYDIVDSEEEKKQKLKHESQNKGCVVALEELEVPERAKADEIAELFERHLELYYSEKQKKLRMEKQESEKIAKEDKQLKKSIEQAAYKYLKLRRRRLEERIPTVNQYLSTLYEQLKVSHPQPMSRNFPFSRKGEAKKRKMKTFPSSFKRYFFAMMKTYVRKKYDYEKDKSNRLGFWAPTNGKSMCVAHKDSLCPPGCNRQTLNQRVYEQSKLVKEQKIASAKEVVSVWDSESYLEERKNIMMTFSDAKECTFQPAICYRMPKAHKTIILQTHNWAQTVVGKLGTWKHFYDQFGENFRKVPTIYRFGQYKRAQVSFRKGDYRKAYQLLALSFNIPDLKIIFRDPEAKVKKDHPIFNVENLGIDVKDLEKVRHEDMQLCDPAQQNKPEFMFLFEVFSFIKMLENYEDQLVESKMNVQKLLKQDQSRFKQRASTAYDVRKMMVKDQMCPLGPECPSLKTRWPNSNISGVTPLGADCLYAHHAFELKFCLELKARKQALKGTLSAINNKLSGNANPKAWNPGGNSLNRCIGCPENALCSNCQLSKQKLKKLKHLRQKAKEAYKQIVKRQSFKEKRVMKKHEEEHFLKKVGLLSRANALYNKERFSEAFEVIVKAVEIVKQEIEQKEKEFEETQIHLKQQLKLDLDMDISVKQVYESTIKPNPDDKYEAQKLHMFAKKTGLDSDPEPDTNRFINTQIELLYRKIEHALTGTVKDIDLMKQKMNKIEELEDKKQKEKDKWRLKKKMCPEFLKEGLCKKGEKECGYSHNYLMLDLEPVDSKLKSLQESVKLKEMSMRESKPPLPWVQTGVKDAEKFNDTKAYDKELEKKRLLSTSARSRSKQKKESSKSTHDLYSQDLEDLKTPVHERKKKSNY